MSNSWLLMIFSGKGEQNHFYEFSSEEARQKFIKLIPDGKKYAVAFDDGKAPVNFINQYNEDESMDLGLD